MSPTKKFGIKLAIYSAFLLYLVGDLFVWNGFFYDKMNSYHKPLSGPAGDSSKHIAYVYGEPITVNQLNRRSVELGLLRRPSVLEMGEGMVITREQDKKDLNLRARYDLLASALLRIKTRFNDLQIPNNEAETARIMKQIKARFDGNEEEYLKTLHEQKLSRNNKLHDRIAARLKQTDQLYRATSQAAEATDAELRTYYDLISDRLRTPDLRPVKHIFLATLNKDEAAVKQQAEELMAQLKAGTPFSQLATDASEDARSAPNGGDLGLISPSAAKEAAGMDIATLPNDTPTLLKGKWGWHIVSAGPLKEGRILSFEEAEPMLRIATRNLRKNIAIQLYMDDLFEDAHLKQRIKFPKK